LGDKKYNGFTQNGAESEIKDYSISFINNEFWKDALAGLFGVLIVLAVFGIIFLVYKISQIRGSRIQDSR
jgi:hypothetical protein